MSRMLIAVVVLLALLPLVLAQPSEPQGWRALREAIERTKKDDLPKLQGRTFDLTVSGARKVDNLLVGPADAFKIDRTDDETFRVTIVNPAALVAPGLLFKYRPIQWSLYRTTEGVAEFGAAIEGRASCRYQVLFRQKDADEIDLSTLDSTYKVSWDLTDPDAVESVKREGPGLTLTRSAGSSNEISIKLRITKEAEGLDVSTDWVAIPTCLVPKASYTPDPTPIPRVVPREDPRPEQCFVMKTESVNICEERCVGFSITQTVVVTNTCERRVKCDEVMFYLEHAGRRVAQFSKWVDLDGKDWTRFDVVLQSAAVSLPFQLSNTRSRCYYR